MCVPTATGLFRAGAMPGASCVTASPRQPQQRQGSSMAKQVKVRVMTPGEFVAESLEAQANKMPRSYKAQADILRKQAAVMRKQRGPKRVRVWEVTE